MSIENARINGLALLGVLLVVMVGCRSYEPNPIDWEHERTVWLEQGALRLASLDDVARLALVGNADLNRMRLKRASAERIAQATGRWDDPEIDADLLRIVNPADNPYLGGVSMSFTLPLSGVKGLERKAAEAYAAADAADIVAAERETAVAARCAAVKMFAARGSAEILRRFASDALVTNALASAERLSQAGELSRTETASARLRRHQRLHRLREAEALVVESEQSLRRLLGVAPGVRLDFAPGWNPLDERVDLSAVISSVPLDYTRHPKVVAAAKRMEGGEVALEAEIHRQYPDLKLGPAYSREDGMDRFGVVAGVTLPLWNRNRKGIAEAEGTRDEARVGVVNAWREVVVDADAARRTLSRLKDHPPESPPNKNDAEALSAAGEINALEYLAVREEALDGELMERDWRRDVRLAEETLRKFELEVK